MIETWFILGVLLCSPDATCLVKPLFLVNGEHTCRYIEESLEAKYGVVFVCTTEREA